MSELPSRQNKKPYYGICDVCKDWHKGEPLCDFPVNPEIERLLSQLQAYKEMCEVYEKANEFYGDEKKYFMREDEVDLNKTTAVFKESYRKNNPDVSKPNIYKGKSYECSARLKVDQGKTAREARAKATEIKKKIEGEG